MAMLPFPMPMATVVSTGQSGFVVITATGAGSWAVPSGFDPSNNVIEIIAGGGLGGGGGGNGGWKGGSGGQYAKLVNFAPSGGSVNYQVGVAGGTVGSSAAPGTADSWFDSASATMYAQGGTSPGTVGGAGTAGGSAPAVGSSTVANGGAGGAGGGLRSQGSGAGGGAGGPHGAGGNGSNNLGSTTGVGGGSGDAGNAAGGAGGGAGAGGNAATEDYWGPGIGPGGGGGSGSTAGNFPGGAGGKYGGGGGGAGSNSVGVAAAGDGILVIRWGDYATNLTAAPVFTQAPVINSNAAPFCAVGDTLTATPGTTMGYVSSTSFQWFADGVAISGATGLSYTLTSAELGKIITITETISNAAGSASASASAIRFGPVDSPTFTPFPRVTTAGDDRVTTAGDVRVSTIRTA